MKPYPLPREQWPKILNHKIVKYVYIGCPLDRTRSVFKQRISNGRAVYTVAHAHYNKGLICFKSKQQLTKYIAIHELAHLIANNKSLNYRGHSREWKNCVKELGGTLEQRRYLKDYRWAKK